MTISVVGIKLSRNTKWNVWSYAHFKFKGSGKFRSWCLSFEGLSSQNGVWKPRSTSSNCVRCGARHAEKPRTIEKQGRNIYHFHSRKHLSDKGKSRNDKLQTKERQPHAKVGQKSSEKHLQLIVVGSRYSNVKWWKKVSKNIIKHYIEQ